MMFVSHLISGTLREHYSIENNEELCSFLKEMIKHNKIEIIQHGVSHDLIDGRGEFSKHIDGKSENINRTINETFTHYYRSLNNDNYDKEQ